MDASELEERVERALTYLRESVTGAAQARANRLHLEHWIKGVKAQQMQFAPPGTVADREAWALASDEYAKALDGYKVSVEQDETYRFKREAAQAVIEAWRTASSNERAARV